MSGRSPRQVALADHLRDAIERLAQALGSDRDALVNEAMHAFAVRHGYAGPGLAGEERRGAAAPVLEAAAALERALETPPEPAAAARAEACLYLVTEDGELGQVRKERFVIGRGKHCDLVIDSAKVSREHAAIVHTGGEFWIEDLGSSNGTWFQKERIERRRIADGDEYFVCSEKIRCVIR